MTTTTSPAVAPTNLSDTDRLLLRALAAGRTNKQIAATTHTAASGVSAAIHDLLHRTGTPNRLNAAALAVIWGLAHDHHVHPEGRPIILALSARQQTILDGWSAGMPDEVLAADLGITPSTVRGYVSPLYDRLGVSTRSQAVGLGVLYDLTSLSTVHPSLPNVLFSAWPERPHCPSGGCH